MKRTKELGFVTGKKKKRYARAFKPYLERVEALYEEHRRQLREQEALRAKQARAAEDAKEIMDLSPSLPLLGTDHYGNRYCFMQKDYNAVYVCCSDQGEEVMKKERERAQNHAGTRARSTESDDDAHVLEQFEKTKDHDFLYGRCMWYP